jgi:hypothetical protein
MHTSETDVQALDRAAPRNRNHTIVARHEKESLLTAAQAHDLFILCDGILINRVMRGRRAMPGMPATSPHTDGYLCVKVNSVKYRAHRVVWLMTYGAWPVGQIDHINGVRDDNRVENLRDVTVTGNQQNQHRRVDNKSGVTGVTSEGPYWRAKIRANGKRIDLGTFKTLEEAAAARKAAEALYGFHPNHGGSDSARRNGLPSLNAPRILRTA